MIRRSRLLVCAALAALGAPSPARAGGFEIPDNGTEALGRGGAFVAKADDPTAIMYNPAGLAEQRGTRALVDGHVVLSSYSFQRFGAYPDDPGDPATPWGGFPYPKVSDRGGAFYAPFLAATTDFGSLDWLTVAVGVFGPSGVANRTYPIGVQGGPAASRYDVVQPASTIFFPTLAAGIKPVDWLDLGVSLHLVRGIFSLSSTSFVDLGDGPSGPCKNLEYHPCDSLSSLHATATSFAATLGAIVKPSRRLAFGLSARTPVTLDGTDGQATVLQAPLGQPIPPPGNATLHTELPWYWRLGARYAFLEDDGFEAGDVELDGTYETWGSSQATGPHIHIDHLGPTGPAFDDINLDVAHHYNDTFSVRLGGAYNVRLPFGVLVARAGAYYDKSATSDNPGYTRLDFDTLDKIAGTLGVGLRWSGFTFNLAYAQVFEPGRTVAPGTGQIRPIDGAQHGNPVDASGNLLPAVNEGQYSGNTQIVSFSVMAVFDEVFGWERAKTWTKPRKLEKAPTEPLKDDEPKADEPKPEEVTPEELKADERKKVVPLPAEDEPPPEPKPAAKPKGRGKPKSKPRPAAAPAWWTPAATPVPAPAATPAPARTPAPSKKSDWDD